MSNQRRHTVTILGAGAIGLSLCARLAARHNVRVIARGRTFTDLAAGNLQCLPVPITNQVETFSDTNYQAVRDASAVFICVKAFQQEAALHALRPMLRPAQPVVLLSNGLNMYHEAATVLTRIQPLVRGLAYFGARWESPVRLVASASVRLELACAPEHLEARETVAALCVESGINCVHTPSVAMAEWRKLLVNVPINLIATTLDAPNSIVLTSERAREAFCAIAEEMRTLARHEGFSLADMTDEALLAGVESYKDNVNSTLADIRRGRRTELPEIAGRCLALARQYGVPMPQTDAWYRLASDRAAVSSKSSGATSAKRLV